MAKLNEIAEIDNNGRILNSGLVMIEAIELLQEIIVVKVPTVVFIPCSLEHFYTLPMQILAHLEFVVENYVERFYLSKK